MTYQRPVPRLTSDNRDFWTGGSEGELRLKQCRDCSTFIHPPRPVCPNCLSDKVEAQAVSGTGVVDTYTINHQPWAPGMEVPFIIARIRLDDAPNVIITSNVINCGVDEVAFGDKVRVTFEQQDEIYYPLFEKVG